MNSSLWIEGLTWEIELNGAASFDRELELRGEFSTETPQVITSAFTSGVVGEGVGQFQYSGRRERSIRTFWRIMFVADQDGEAKDRDGIFGFYNPEINDLTLLCAASDRRWLVELLAIHKNPTIYCRLRRLSEEAETFAVSNFRVVSDKRAIIRDEAR